MDTSGSQPITVEAASSRLHPKRGRDSTITQVVASTRMPLQNRGFLMRGQTGLRPCARQNGGLPQHFLQRFCEVVIGDLQVVLRRDRL